MAEKLTLRYSPWQEDEPSPLEEMSESQLSYALKNYKESLSQGEIEQDSSVTTQPSPSENPSALDLVLKNHPHLSREKALKLLNSF